MSFIKLDRILMIESTVRYYITTTTITIILTYTITANNNNVVDET